MKSFITAFILILFSSVMFGQGAFLERGQSGLGVGVGFSTNENSSSFGVSLGYSISGIVDLGFSVERVNADNDLHATAVSPSLSFYPLKQNESVPFTLGFGFGYQSQELSSDSFGGYDVEISGDYYSIGASLQRTIYASDRSRVQPMIGVSFVTGTTKVKTSWGSGESEDDATGFSLGLAGIFDVSPKTIFALTPQIGISEGVTSFGVNIAFIFKTKQ